MSLLFVGLLLGVVIEEITFLGFFIGWGTVLFGERWGFPLLVVTSLVFGLGHRYQDLPGAITAGISGVMFGLVYLGAGRKLLPAIATHMTSNFWGITEIYLHGRSEEHTSELQSLMRISYAVFCLTKKK